MNNNFEKIGENVGQRLAQDLQTYLAPSDNLRSPKSWLKLLVQFHRHPGVWAIVVYRYGQWARFSPKSKLLRPLFLFVYLILFHRVRTHWQIEIPATANIDGGFRIFHFGSIIVNGETVAGKNFTINHGVLIGNNGKDEMDTCPRFGDNVTVNVGAKIFGKIQIGNNVEIGACSLVNKSFPDDVIVAGVPAKTLKHKQSNI